MRRSLEAPVTFGKDLLSFLTRTFVKGFSLKRQATAMLSSFILVRRIAMTAMIQYETQCF
jgi:hypothetical protein